MTQRGKVRASYSAAVGRNRGDLYKRSLDRSRRALKAGFYIESIALTESLLADRLESCLAILTGEPVTFQTTGQAAKSLQGHPSFPNQDLLADIQRWARRRNRAIHEFAKISEGDGQPSWHLRLREARLVAEVGLTLLAALSRENKALTRPRRFPAR